jgi:hypothetical protein
MLAVKFVNWDVSPLENLKETKVYVLKTKVENGQKLDRDERNFVTEKVNNNSYFKMAIPLMGWKFDFSKVLSLFIVKQYGSTQEYYATDKTALRKILYGKIDYIKELR